MLWNRQKMLLLIYSIIMNGFKFFLHELTERCSGDWDTDYLVKKTKIYLEHKSCKNIWFGKLTRLFLFNFT